MNIGARIKRFKREDVNNDYGHLCSSLGILALLYACLSFASQLSRRLNPAKLKVMFPSLQSDL